MSSRKRPQDEDLGGSLKKTKGGPSFLPPKGDLRDLAMPNPNLPAKPLVANAEEIARKRAEIAAKFAAMRGPPKPTTSALPVPPPPAVGGGGSGADPDLMRKVAEARQKVLALAARSKNPYLSQQETAPSSSTVAGGVHPLLMDQSTAGPSSKKDRFKPMAPKFATVKANVKAGAPAPQRPRPEYASPSNDAVEDNRNNPYFDKKLAEFVAEGGKDRERKKLKFNQKGKFIQLGEQARQEAKLEELKRKIAETARKAGLEDEMATVEKQVRRAPPPQVEWWDEDYLPNKDYSDVASGKASERIHAADSPITIYIQHPIQLPAPSDKNKVDLKPLKLTKKEMKKMRRQRRRAAQEDKHDRQRMGLIPPDPPKVKLSNMMKVLTSDAVADPTKIEARVRREMMQRRKIHERDNEARKLTDEQRREKTEKRKEEDEAKGIHTLVFRIRYLSNPQHRFKVRKNAEQHSLTGVAIFNPKFVLVVVEGGAKAIKQYRHLMEHRINWTEEARARASAMTPTPGAADDGDGVEGPEGEGMPEPQSLADNKCEVIWSGEARERAFKTFRPKNCPTDNLAKEFLGPRMEGFWDVAKKWNEARDD